MSKSGNSRIYQPTSHNRTINSIIENLKLDSLEQIEQLSDNDIEFLISTLCYKKNILTNRLTSLITPTYHDIRKTKIEFLLENIIYKILRTNQ